MVEGLTRRKKSSREEVMASLSTPEVTELTYEEMNALTSLSIKLNHGDPVIPFEVRDLLGYGGAVVEDKIHLFRIALYRAVTWGPPQKKFARNVVKLLLTLPSPGRGVNVNTMYFPPINGVTMRPLHYAAIFGNKDIVDLILDAGADVDAKDSNGKTAYEVAKEKGNNQTADAIASRSPNPSAPPATPPPAAAPSGAFGSTPGGRRKSRLNVKRRGTKRHGRSGKHRKLRKLATRRR